MTDTVQFLKDNRNWLGAGALLTFLSSFGQTFFISLFSGRIQEDFGLSDGDWGLIYAFGTLASAGVMVWAGSLADRYRSRQIGVIVLIGLAVACMVMAANTSVGVLVVVVFLLRFFGQGMSSHVAVVAMSRWFVATRGRALAVCTLGFTVGEAAFPILVVALMGFIDWRLLWVVAAIIALIGAGLLYRLLGQERHPQQIASETSTVGMRGLNWTRADVLRHPLFWLFVPALLGPSAFGTAFFFHQVHFAELKGWSHLALVSFFPVYTVAAVLAMLVSGRALDRYGTSRLLPFYQVPMILAFLLFAVGENWVLLSAGLILMAMMTGANATLPNAFWAEYYGTRNIGSIKAMAAAVMVLGSAIGPGITGFYIDQGVSLTDQYVVISGFFVLTTAGLWAGIRLYQRDLRR